MRRSKVTMLDKSILMRLATGLTAKEIGQLLTLSEAGIRKRIAKLNAAMGTRNVVSLVLVAVALGWIHNPYLRGGGLR